MQKKTDYPTEAQIELLWKAWETEGKAGLEKALEKVADLKEPTQEQLEETMFDGEKDL